MEEIYISKSARDTAKLGEEFITRLHLCQGVTLTSRVIALYGELGSGKTTFVQGMAVGLGVKQRIISPTFVIVRSYPFDKLRAGKLEVRSFYHIDLYRIDGRNNIEGLGLEEIINDSQNIVAVEWAERMGKLLPKNRIDIYFEHIDEHKRRITIKRSN